mgnify:CR=1 FL=1
MTIITKGMGLAYKFLKPKVTNAIGKVKKDKINKIKKQAAATIAAGTGVAGLGVLKAKSILDQDTRENTTSRDVYMQKEKKNKK